MRVLVTGGAGFVGSHIVYWLVQQEVQVLVVDNLSTGKQTNLPDGVCLKKMDIRDPALLEITSSFQPDVITHCAGQTSVAISMADPLLDATININGGINVCRAAIRSECSQFVYVSTGGALYGPPDYLPYDEDHPIRPVSSYGLSKWTLECYLKMLLPSTVQLSVLRLANVYGPRQDPAGETGVVSIFGNRMLQGKQVTIFGDGEQTRDFIFIADVVRAHGLALEASEPVTVNISSEEAITVNELFGLMAAETYYTHPPMYEDDRPGEAKHVVLSNARAKRLLDWVPEKSLQDGLHETLAWLDTKT